MLGGWWPLLLFGITHGGSEVLVLRHFAGEIRDSALAPKGPVILSHDHAGMRASWQRGTPSIGSALLGAVVGGLVHVVLFGSLAFAVFAEGTTVTGVFFASIFAAMWTYTLVALGRALLRTHEAMGTITIDANFDRVRIEETLPGGEASVVELRTVGLDVQLEGLLLRLTAQDQFWAGPLPLDEPSERVVELLRALGATATAPEPQAVPEALAGMLERPGPH